MAATGTRAMALNTEEKLAQIDEVHLPRHMFVSDLFFMLLLACFLIGFPGDIPEPWTAIFVCLFIPPITWVSTKGALLFTRKIKSQKSFLICSAFASYIISSFISGFLVNCFLYLINDDSCACEDDPYYHFWPYLLNVLIFWYAINAVFFLVSSAAYYDLHLKRDTNE